MNKKSIEIICTYCGWKNKVNYLGKEKPKKVHFQCRNCRADIKYADEVSRNFVWNY